MGHAATETKLKIRFMEAGDKPFVASTWLRSYQSSQRLSRAGVAKHAAWVVDRLLRASIQCIDQNIPNRQPVISLVMCSSARPEILHGFVCGVPEQFVHYVYVARDLRERGHGRRLMKAMVPKYPTVIPCSHKSDVKRLSFDPTLIATIRG